MNHTSQTFFTRGNTGPLPNYEMLREEHEVRVLGAPPPAAPVAPTVINIHSETSVPNHVVWSLFNTIFMNWCCLGFITLVYSLKSRNRKMTGDVIGAQAYASTTECLNICTLVLGILMVTAIIICFIIKPAIIHQMISEMKKYFEGFQ
ncbi:interferon-induced transmembrane protein 3 [Tupaia chinensis]|nr:interferon-induced transmembrane protein 3 [Tupaia chinensis]